MRFYRDPTFWGFFGAPFILVVVLFIMIALAGCVSLHSDAVTQDHWNACQRYCAPGNIKEACDGWLGAGCKCTDGRTVWFEIQEFEDD